MPKSKKTSTKSEPEPVVETPVVETPVVETPVVETPVVETKESVRKVVNQDTVMELFSKLLNQIENDISELRNDGSKTKGIKYLKSVNKDIKEIQSQTVKIFKQKDKKTRKTTNNVSGFKKPVAISTELAKFAGWKDDELHSRVDVTNFICNYIKSHDLQDPSDRRNIHPDKKLKKLLGISNESKPLKYYDIQTHLKNQKHYP